MNPRISIIPSNAAPNFYHVSYDGKLVGTVLLKKDKSSWGYSDSRSGPWTWGYQNSYQAIRTLLKSMGLKEAGKKKVLYPKKLGPVEYDHPDKKDSTMEGTQTSSAPSLPATFIPSDYGYPPYPANPVIASVRGFTKTAIISREKALSIIVDFADKWQESEYHGQPAQQIPPAIFVLIKKFIPEAIYQGTLYRSIKIVGSKILGISSASSLIQSIKQYQHPTTPSYFSWSKTLEGVLTWAANDRTGSILYPGKESVDIIMSTKASEGIDFEKLEDTLISEGLLSEHSRATFIEEVMAPITPDVQILEYVVHYSKDNKQEQVRLNNFTQVKEVLTKSIQGEAQETKDRKKSLQERYLYRLKNRQPSHWLEENKADLRGFTKIAGLKEKIDLLTNKYFNAHLKGKRGHLRLQDSQSEKGQRDDFRELIAGWANEDPTSNKAYLEWIVRQLVVNDYMEEEGELHDLLTRFEEAKKSRKIPLDINAYKTPGQLYDAVEKVEGEGGTGWEAGAPVVLDRPPYKVIRLDSQKAAAKLCKGTEWCVRAPNMYQRYAKQGPLYLIYKDGERYALVHYESGQLMNINDEQVSSDQVKELINLLEPVTKISLKNVDKKAKEVIRHQVVELLLDAPLEWWGGGLTAGDIEEMISEGAWGDSLPWDSVLGSETIHKFLREIIQEPDIIQMAEEADQKQAAALALSGNLRGFTKSSKKKKKKYSPYGHGFWPFFFAPMGVHPGGGGGMCGPGGGGMGGGMGGGGAGGGCGGAGGGGGAGAALKGFTKTAKDAKIKPFYLDREEDETGVSGTGKVAYGLVLPSGRAVIEWTTGHPSITIFNDIDELLAVHGHDGKTQVKYLKDTEAAAIKKLIRMAQTTQIEQEKVQEDWSQERRDNFYEPHFKEEIEHFIALCKATQTLFGEDRIGEARVEANTAELWLKMLETNKNVPKSLHSTLSSLRKEFEELKATISTAEKAGIKPQRGKEGILHVIQTTSPDEWPQLLRGETEGYDINRIKELEERGHFGDFMEYSLRFSDPSMSHLKWLSEQDFYDFYALSLSLPYIHEGLPSGWQKGAGRVIVDFVQNMAQNIINIAKVACTGELRHYVAQVGERNTKAIIKNVTRLQKMFGSVEEFKKKAANNGLSWEQIIGLFNDPWNSPYGGKPYATIAEEAQKLEVMLPVTLNNVKKVVAQTDHVIDLEHNNDLFLNWFTTFGQDDPDYETDYESLGQLLDDKSENWDLKFLAHKSPQMYAIYQNLQRPLLQYKSTARRFTKIAQMQPGALLTGLPEPGSLVGTPQIEIDPTIAAEIGDAVEQLRATDPNYFKDVSKIVALHGGPYGQVSSEDPSVIHLNVQKIQGEVKAKFGTFDSNNPEHREAFEEAIKHALVEVITHEKGHVSDWDPEHHQFLGGEGVAEREVQMIMPRVFHSSVSIGFCKVAGLEEKIPVLSQKYNITKEQIQDLANYDPTNNKTYIEWIIRINQKSPLDKQHTIDTLKVFEKAKKSTAPISKDINSYKTFESLEQALQTYSEQEHKPKREQSRESFQKGQEVVYDQPPYRVIKVTTAEAAAHLFRNTKWCVKDPEYFKTYVPSVFYYVEKNNKAYVLVHRESDQINGVDDQPIEEQGRPEIIELLAPIIGLKNPVLWSLDTMLEYTKAHGRQPEVEQEVKKNPEWALHYAREIIKGRWPEIEETIKKDIDLAFSYALDVIKGRWPELEEEIKKDPMWILNYAKDIIKGRWPEGEEIIKKDPKWAYLYAKGVIKGRWPEAEETIKKDPEQASEYAEMFIKGRWPEAEEQIKKDPRAAYRYAMNIIKGRWPEAEEVIKKDSWSAYTYALHVIKGRWPEAEEVIKKNSFAAVRYAMFIMEHRWLEAEENMMQAGPSQKQKDIRDYAKAFDLEITPTGFEEKVKGVPLQAPHTDHIDSSVKGFTKTASTLPHDAKWSSPDGGFSRVWMFSNTGNRTFWKVKGEWREVENPTWDFGQMLASKSSVVKEIRHQFFGEDLWSIEGSTRGFCKVAQEVLGPELPYEEDLFGKNPTKVRIGPPVRLPTRMEVTMDLLHQIIDRGNEDELERFFYTLSPATQKLALEEIAKYHPLWQASALYKRLSKTAQQHKTVIGIDIDGVIANTHNILMDIASEFVPVDEEDRKQYRVEDIKHGYPELRGQVFEKVYERKAIADAPVMPHAVEKINEIFDAGHKVVLITARPKNWEDQTREWLKKIGLKHHTLIFCSNEAKGEKAKEEGVQVFIEDKPENLESIAEHGIRVCAFEQPWNKDVDVPHITDWRNVRAFLQTAINFKPQEVQRVEETLKRIKNKINQLPAEDQQEWNKVLKQFKARTQGISEREVQIVEDNLDDALKIIEEKRKKAEREQHRQKAFEVGFKDLPEGELRTILRQRKKEFLESIEVLKDTYSAVEQHEPEEAKERRIHMLNLVPGKAVIYFDEVAQLIEKKEDLSYLDEQLRNFKIKELEEIDVFGTEHKGRVEKKSNEAISAFFKEAGISYPPEGAVVFFLSGREIYRHTDRFKKEGYRPQNMYTVEKDKKTYDQMQFANKEISTTTIPSSNISPGTGEDRLRQWKGRFPCRIDWDTATGHPDKGVFDLLKALSDKAATNPQQFKELKIIEFTLHTQRAGICGLVEKSYGEDILRVHPELLQMKRTKREDDEAAFCNSLLNWGLERLMNDFLASSRAPFRLKQILGQPYKGKSGIRNMFMGTYVVESAAASQMIQHISDTDTGTMSTKEMEDIFGIEMGTGTFRSFTKFSAPRWTTEEKNRLKDLYIKYRERGYPHHIIYKAVAHLLNKSWVAVKQKLETMYDIDNDLKPMKYEHWDKGRIDQMLQELYRGGQDINRLGLPATLMYQITNHSKPKAETCGFPAYYDSFDYAVASNILAVGLEREGDKLTDKPIKTLEDALKYYRRQEKLAHAWTKDEIVALLREAHVAGLPLTCSFFKSHPKIYMPLLGVGRSLEGLKDSVKRNGYSWADLVVEAAPEYVDLYNDEGKLKSSTEELRIRRFLEINNIPFKVATIQDKIAVSDPVLIELGYKHFVPDFFILDQRGSIQGVVEVFGSIADSAASNTAEIYREKKQAKESFYKTLPYRFVAINNNSDGVDLTDEVLQEKFNYFLQG